MCENNVLNAIWMKLKPYHIALIAGLFFLAQAAYAQESSSPVMESMEAEKERSQYFPAGDDVNNVFARDSAYSRTIQPKTDVSRSSEKTGSREEDDSVLSFNFLYYIIQKFKMSDIVDQ